MSTFPVVKGERLRATKIDSCGMPVAGPANFVVTRGWVALDINKVNREAQDLEQTNAEGVVCVTDRTPPVRKYYSPVLELCNVNTCLLTMFNGWEQVLDYADLPVGFRDQPEVTTDFGVALEIWTGGHGDDDCPIPADDSIFSSSVSGRHWGYFLLGGTEWELGNIRIGAQVSTFTLTGRTIAMPHWGRGPWNVAALDSSGTAGRLLVPVGKKEHLTVFRTPIAPPDPTPSESCCTLAIATAFVDPDFYYGGLTGEPAADVAPPQPVCTETMVSYHLTVTGTPTGGTFKLTYNGIETGTVPYNATPSQVKTALLALSNIDPGEVDVSGTALPGGTITITLADGPTLTPTTPAFVGGTTPAAHVVLV